MQPRRATDLTVVGAGPAGLFAAYYAGFRGLTVTVVDAQPDPGGQVTALYPTKLIHDVAGFPGVSGTDLIAGLMAQAEAYEPRMTFGHNVVDVVRDDASAGLVVTLDNGSAIDSRAVVLATGVGGIRPRTLPLGHGWHGRGLTYVVSDVTDHVDQDVVVVGGGDSALDWAVELQPVARSVTVVHRRKSFRAHAGSLRQAERLGVHLLTECEIQAVHGDDTVRSVVLRDAAGAETEIPADAIIGALGLVTAPSPFAAWGIVMRDRKIAVDTAMQTSVPGVFAIGDASTYTGKVALMATGFGEAATAVNNAAVLVDPDLTLFPGHSTDEELGGVPAGDDEGR
ncbi:MAG: NAD(P)/FAD-dependent oxidoreductase [Cellulomonadaceae bacterium]|nr:NAD(P)/FAD-dependent oxidoreductase [Cellulomonadaceae bacterium]